jgi:hypothetical protein
VLKQQILKFARAPIIFRRLLERSCPGVLFKTRIYGDFRLHVLRRPGEIASAYYEYVAGLIGHSLSEKSIAGDVWLWMSPGSSFQAIPQNAKSLVIQLEHTLVLPGGRDSVGAAPGAVIAEDGITNYLVRMDGAIEPLAASDGVIEYSIPNIVNVRTSSLSWLYRDKVQYIAPLIVEVSQRKVPTTPFTAITLFSEPLSPRRELIVGELRDMGIQVRNIVGVWDDYETLYDSTTLLINIHQTDHHHTLEELRVLPALLRKVIVVSESVPLIESVPYSPFIQFAEYQDISALVQIIANNPNHFWEELFGSRSGFDRLMINLSEDNQTAAKALLSRDLL